MESIYLIIMETSFLKLDIQNLQSMKILFHLMVLLYALLVTRQIMTNMLYLLTVMNVPTKKEMRIACFAT